MGQVAVVFAGAINGDVDEKRGRLALKAATAFAELYQAENRARLIAHQVGEAVQKFGSTPIYHSENQKSS